jgi:hypothetical protein
MLSLGFSCWVHASASMARVTKRMRSRRSHGFAPLGAANAARPKLRYPVGRIRTFERSGATKQQEGSVMENKVPMSRLHYDHNSIKARVKRSARSAPRGVVRRAGAHRKQLRFGPELACPGTEFAWKTGSIP